MKAQALSAFVRRIPWPSGRKRRLATAARCLETNGWTIERLTTKELGATCMDGGINHHVWFRPPEKPAMGWTGFQLPRESQRPPLPECFSEFMG
jgi:hypothetical protein